jgi:UDP-N-acetylglucosamine acyltransferase
MNFTSTDTNMIRVHPTAVVDPQAELETGVTVGPYCVIESNARIGKNCWIGPHVHVASGTRIGAACRIFTGAALGNPPQDLKFAGEETTLEIGERTTIREFVTLNRGTKEHWKTVIGSDCLLMAYSHVAHDCIIGNHCILANSVNLAGHVVIEDWASLGGMVPVHQFVRIGQHCFVGGGYRVTKDVPPYIRTMGDPSTYAGLNSVGLSRRGFSLGARLALKRAYKVLYRAKLNVSQAVQRIREECELTPEVQNVLAFIEKSERGIIG